MGSLPPFDAKNRIWIVLSERLCWGHPLPAAMHIEPDLLLPSISQTDEKCWLCHYFNTTSTLEEQAQCASNWDFDTEWEKEKIDELNSKFDETFELVEGQAVYNQTLPNPLNIEDYMDKWLYQSEANGFNWLFVAPTGLGKTKFAPGLLAKRFGASCIALITERVIATRGAAAWYKEHKLEGVSTIVSKAGGVKETIDVNNEGVPMFVYTTGAYVSNKVFKDLPRDTLLIIDEAHNFSTDTITAVCTVSHGKQYRQPAWSLQVTASPRQKVPVSICTPLPRKVILTPLLNEGMVWDEVEKKGRHSLLHILPGHNSCKKLAPYYCVDKQCRVIIKVRGSCYEWKQSLEHINFPEEQLPEVTKGHKIVVLATEVLQESVTLNCNVVADNGQRYRPSVNYSGVEDVRNEEDFKLFFGAQEADMTRDINISEITQVAGRVGRTEWSRDGVAIIGRAFPLTHESLEQAYGTRKGRLMGQVSDYIPVAAINIAKKLQEGWEKQAPYYRAEKNLQRITDVFVQTSTPGPYTDYKTALPFITNTYGGEWVPKSYINASTTTFDTIKYPEIKKVVRSGMGRIAYPTLGCNTSSVKTAPPPAVNAWGTKLSFLQRSITNDVEPSTSNVTEEVPRPDSACSTHSELSYLTVPDEHIPTIEAEEITTSQSFHFESDLCVQVKLPGGAAHNVDIRPRALVKLPKGKGRRTREQTIDNASRKFCYSYLFPEAKREEAIKKLGYMPRLHEVVSLLDHESVTSFETLKFSFAKAGIVHVYKQRKPRKGDFNAYMRRLADRQPNYRLGLDLSDEAVASDESLAHMKDLTVKQRHELVSQELALSEFLAPIVEEMAEEIKPIYVRSPGDCYKRLVGITSALQGNNVTISDVLEHSKEIIRRGHLIEWCVMPDGDVHVIDVFSPQQRLQKVMDRASRMRNGELNVPRVPKGKKPELFIEALKTMNEQQLVSNNETRYQDPVRKAITQLNTALNLENIDNSLVPAIEKGLNLGNLYCPWVVPEHNAMYLKNWGINVGCGATVEHAHPVHAAMRRYIHITKLPSLLPEGGDLYWVSDSTAALLPKEFRSQCAIRNSHVSARDFARYRTVEPMSSMLHTTAKRVFMSECAQYFTPSDVAAFHEANPLVEVAYWCGIVPPESMVCNYSLRPTLYTFKIVGETLHYKCESDEDEYAQPLAAHWWYVARTIQGFKSTITVTREWRKGPFFIMSTTTQKVAKELTRDLGDVGYFKLSNVAVRSPIPDLVVSSEIVNMLYLYGESIKNCEKRDLTAQLRRWYPSENCKAMPLNVLKTAVIMVDMLLKYSPNYEFESSLVGPFERLRQLTTGKLYDLTLGSWAANQKKRYNELLSTWNNSMVFDTCIFRVRTTQLSNALVPPIRDGMTFAGVYADHNQKMWSEVIGRFKASVYNNMEANRKMTQNKFLKEMISEPTNARALEKVDFSEGRPEMVNLEMPSREALQRTIAKAASYDTRLPPVSLTASTLEHMKYVARARIEKRFEDHLKDRDVLQSIMEVTELSAEAKEHDSLAVGGEKLNLNEGIVDESLVACVENDLALMSKHCGSTRQCGQHPLLTLEELSKLPTCAEGFRARGVTGALCCHACASASISKANTYEDAKGKCKMVEVEDEEGNQEMAIVPIASDDNKVQIMPDTKTGETAPPKIKGLASDEQIIVRAEDRVVRFAGYNLRIPLGASRETWITAVYGVTTKDRWNARLLSNARGCHIIMPPPEQDCLLQVFNKLTGRSIGELWRQLNEKPANEFLDDLEHKSPYLSIYVLEALALMCHVAVEVVPKPDDYPSMYGVKSGAIAIVHYANKHFSLAKEPEYKQFSYGGTARFDSLDTSQLETIHTLKSYVPDNNRASLYMRTLRSGKTGTLLAQCGEKHLQMHEKTLKKGNFAPVRISFMTGDPGCGKSHATREAIQGKEWWTPNQPVTAICPTIPLRDDWAEILQIQQRQPAVKSNSNCTFEIGLMHTNSPVVVIDELSKYPPGYVDALIGLHPSIKMILMLGDPHQMSWHEPKEDCPLNDTQKFVPEAKYFAWAISKYMVGTRRLAQQVAAALGLPSSSKNSKAKFIAVDRVPAGQPVIVPSRGMVNTMSDYFGAPATTYASSQGKDYNEDYTVEINITYLKHPDHNALWTAVTRGKKNVSLFFDFVFEGQYRNMVVQNPLLHRLWLLTHGTSLESLPPFDLVAYLGNATESSWCLRELAFPLSEVTNHKMMHVPVLLKDDSDPRGYSLKRFDVHKDEPSWLMEGGRKSRAESAYKEHKNRKGETVENLDALAYSQLVDPVKIKEPDKPLDVFKKSVLKQSSVRMEPNALREAFLNTKPNELRELWHEKTGPSEQFPDGNIDGQTPRFKVRSDVHNTNAIVSKTGADPAFIEGAHKMSNKDSTARNAAVKKRLRFADSVEKQVTVMTNQDVVNALFNSVCDMIPNLGRYRYNDYDYDEAVLANEANRFDRKTSTIVANARERASFAYGYEYNVHPENFIDIGFKNEYKCKPETLNGDAKPLQTLATMHDAIFHKLGGFTRVMTQCLLKSLPDNLYVHIGTSPSTLDEWCKEHWRSSSGQSIDYTAFDQSQNGIIMEACIKVYERMGAPIDMINTYRDWKMNVHSRFGEHDVQRFTGECETILGNTLCGIMLANARYQLTNGNGPTEPACFVGDDAAWYPGKMERPTWKLLEPRMNFVLKTQVETPATFVGWRLTSEGIFKDPQILYYRYRLKVETRQIAESMLSYAYEAGFAYRHPDIAQHCNELDLTCHQALMRELLSNHTFCKHFTHLLTGDVRVENHVEIGKVDVSQDMLRHWANTATDRNLYRKGLRVLRYAASHWTGEHVKLQRSLKADHMLGYFSRVLREQ